MTPADRRRARGRRGAWSRPRPACRSSAAPAGELGDGQIRGGPPQRDARARSGALTFYFDLGGAPRRGAAAGRAVADAAEPRGGATRRCAASASAPSSTTSASARPTPLTGCEPAHRSLAPDRASRRARGQDGCGDAASRGGRAVARCAVAAPRRRRPDPERLPATTTPGGFRNILPPGQGQSVNARRDRRLPRPTAPRPPHDDDQLQMYEDLVYATPGLTAAQIADYFKDASFGVQPGQRRAHLQPARRRDDRPRHSFGVPHIYGVDPRRTRCSAPATPPPRTACSSWTCCATPAAPSSRRSPAAPTTGDGRATSGPTRPTPRPTSSSSSTSADELYGAEGAQLQQDVDNYVAGINQYIAEACADPTQDAGRVRR